jgi:hypothetical protein
MKMIRHHQGDFEARCDTDALDVIQLEYERDGAGGADLVEVVGHALAARKDSYGTGLSTSRPVVALLTTVPDFGPEVFAGYWQADGSWRDADGRSGAFGLTQTIVALLTQGDFLTSRAVISVTVDFVSFAGESPPSRFWLREDFDGDPELPVCKPG